MISKVSSASKTGPGVVAKPPDHGGVDVDPVGAIALSRQQVAHLLEFRDAFGPDIGPADCVAQVLQGFGHVGGFGRQERQNRLGLIVGQSDTVDIGARGVEPALAQKLTHPRRADLVELVDGAQDICPLRLICDAGRFQHTVENLAIVGPDNGIGAKAKDIEDVGQHGTDFGVGRHGGRADSVGITLIELPEPARPRLFVAPDRPHGIAPVGRWQVIAVLGIDPRKRRCQVVAERNPAVVVAFPGKDTFVGPVHIRKKLAQRLDRFDGRAFKRVEAVAMVDLRNARQHLRAFGHIWAKIVAEALGRDRLGARGLLLFRHGSAEIAGFLVAPASTGWVAAEQARPSCPGQPNFETKFVHDFRVENRQRLTRARPPAHLAACLA